MVCVCLQQQADYEEHIGAVQGHNVAFPGEQLPVVLPELTG